MASFDKQTKTQATAWMNLKAWFPAEGRHGGAQAAQLHACKALRQQRLMYSWRKPCFLLWMEGSWHGTRWTFLGIMVKLCALTGPQVCGQSHLSKLRGFRYLGFVCFLLWTLKYYMVSVNRSVLYAWTLLRQRVLSVLRQSMLVLALFPVYSIKAELPTVTSMLLSGLGASISFISFLAMFSEVTLVCFQTHHPRSRLKALVLVVPSALQ